MVKWYVYTLSNEGYVFYVGISRDVLKRYKCHCSFPYEQTTNYIYQLKMIGKLPDLTILQCCNSQQYAECAETALIRHFSSIKHKLCNYSTNPIENKLPDIKVINKQLYRLKKNYAVPIVKKAFDEFYLIKKVF